MHSTTLATGAEPSHGADNVRAVAAIASLAATCALSPGCRRDVDPGPDLQIVGESTRVRLEDPYPAQTPWLVDGTVLLVSGIGENVGIQVLHRFPGPVTLTFAYEHILVSAFDVDSFPVTRASSEMYGGGRTGTFPDGLRPTKVPTTNPAYFSFRASWVAEPGHYTGELSVGGRTLPVSLTVVDAHIPAVAPRVWAYGDPREIAWANAAPPDVVAPEAPSKSETSCESVFHWHDVNYMPDLHLDWWPARRPYATLRDLPVVIPTDPATVGDAVRAWIEATRNTQHVPFAIPIDEPSTPEKRAKVIELAKAVRAAGGGPKTFRFAVTDDPRPEYGDLIDLYISLRTPRSANGTQWTYNGAPPRAGSMVLDAATPGTRTWGWIAYRWNIPVWYVWDATYWHDRHNRKGAPLPGKALDPKVDPTSFENDEDHGNLDGVLALPNPRGGCFSTLRLAALRRGQEDRALLELAAKCDAAAVDALVAKMVPEALGDAPKSGKPSWPTDEAAWELARREALRIAATCAPH
jgi:hypothetical protein